MMVYELLANPARHTKTAFARDSSGLPVKPTSGEAVQWCLMGAVRFCYPRPDEQLGVVDKLYHALRPKNKLPLYPGEALTNYNDQFSTKPTDILALAVKANV